MIGEVGQPLPDESATQEARACCSLCAVKEFLIVGSLFLIVLDLADVYANIVRISGSDALPFPGNHTDFYYTSAPELSWYDMGCTLLDLFSCILMGLSVCSNSIDGLVCSLCGFASAMMLEFVYVMWLCVAVTFESVREGLTTRTVYMLLGYTVFPYLGLFVIRCYVLMKAQAFRRSLKRSKEFRARFNEKSNLLRP